MARPPVIAYHLVWTAYGNWLPNDPRGSMSQSVAVDAIAELGELHYGRRNIQPRRDAVRKFYDRADEVLKHPRLRFSEEEFPTIAGGLDAGAQENRYTCYACAVMPDHVHVVIRKHRHRAEEMIARLQCASRTAFWNARPELLAEEHPVWTSGGWKGFLESPDQINGTIRYVERNPPKAHLPPQHWSFITPYDNWPFHRRAR